MKNMKILAALIVSIIAAFVGLQYHFPPLAAVGSIATVVFFVMALKRDAKATAAGNAQIKQTDAQLRQELIETQKLALSKLANADDELKGKVAELLVEAGKHLGNPYTNSRVIYSSQYFINWNREGLALVAQARQLIDGAAGDSQPKA